MQHLRWNKQGRTFYDSKTGKYTYKSSLGQHNVDLGNGSFAPYVWDSTKKTVKFADCELRLTDTGIEFWSGKEKLNSLAIHPEVKTLTTWSRATPTKSNVTVEEIDPGTAKAEIKLTYSLTTNDQTATVSIRAGYNAKVNFELENTALKSGEQRLLLAFKEKAEAVPRYDLKGKELTPCEYSFGKSHWKWKPDEEATHVIAQKTEYTEIRVAEKTYTKDESLKISPDTWGSDVGIAANADDGFDNATDNEWLANGFGNQIVVGSVSWIGWNQVNGGWRWDNITIDGTATIDSATIDIYLSKDGDYIGVNGTLNCNWQAWDTDDAGQFSASDRPETVTKTTASVAFALDTSGAIGWKTTGNLASIVQEIIDRAGWASGNAINFVAINTGSGDNHADFEDYNHAGSNEAELTITYTAAGGDPEGSLIHGKLLRGGLLMHGVLIGG